MKKAKLEGDRDIVKEIASEISKPTIRVSAEDVLTSDLEEQACTAARTYWMMGWSWEEIETVLYDLDYPEKLVSKAVQETKEYAKDFLKDGPFNPYMSGQSIKLKNGHVSTLVSVSDTAMTIEDEEHGQYTVSLDMVDVEASNKLLEAYNLRSSAKAMLSLIAYKLPPAPATDEYEKPSKEPQEYGFSEMPFAPAGTAEIVPEQGDAKPINKKLEEALSTLAGLEATQEELEEKVGGIREKYLNPLNREVKDMDAKKAEALKKFYLVLNEIGEGIKGNEVLFRDYKGKLIAIRNEVKEHELTPLPEQELQALKDILNLNHSDIADKAIKALNQWKEAASTVDKHVEKKVYMFPYRKIPLEEREEWMQNKHKSSSAGAEEDMKEVWRQVRKASDEFQKDLKVLVSVNAQLDAILGKFHECNVERKMTAAIKTVCKR